MARRVARLCIGGCGGTVVGADLCRRCRVPGDPYGERSYRRARRAARAHLGRPCALCGQRMTAANPPTVDHIRPVRAGGGSAASNLRVVCRRCNAREV